MTEKDKRGYGLVTTVDGHVIDVLTDDTGYTARTTLEDILLCPDSALTTEFIEGKMESFLLQTADAEMGVETDMDGTNDADMHALPAKKGSKHSERDETSVNTA